MRWRSRISGFLYQNGLGVPLNYAEAYKWFTLAANGWTSSRRALEALTQIMTKAQLRDGQAKVSDWLSHHGNLEFTGENTEAMELDSYAAAQP